MMHSAHAPDPYSGHAGALLYVAEQLTTTWLSALDELDEVPWWRFRKRAALRRYASSLRVQALKAARASAIADGDLD